MNKCLLFNSFAPRFILAAGLMMTVADMTALAMPEPEPQQQSQSTYVVKGTVIDHEIPMGGCWPASITSCIWSERFFL